VISEYKQIFELFDECIVIRDLDGRIKAWNDSAEKTFGWSREDVMGKRASEALEAPGLGALPLPPLEQKQESVVRTQAGVVRMSVVSRYLRDAEGQATAIMDVFRTLHNN